jgi:Conserved mid region of cactin
LAFLQEEIIKVQKRREERELDKLRQEEELQFLARERAIAEGAELDKKEELVGVVAASSHVIWCHHGVILVADPGQWGTRCRQQLEQPLHAIATCGTDRRSTCQIGSLNMKAPPCCCAQFHLEQAKARTQQRLREGRPKPIDVIVRNLYFPDDVDADGADPYEIAKSLTLPELRGLADDVQDYQVHLHSNFEALSYWNLGGVVGRRLLHLFEAFVHDTSAVLHRGGAGSPKQVYGKTT